MTSRCGPRILRLSLPARILASVLLAIAIGLAGLSAGHAQESEQPAWSLKRLFTSRPAEPAAPRQKPRPAAKPAAARKKNRVAREPIDPQVTVVEKRPDAKVIMVVGDFLGSGLAEGLSTAYAENPHVRVDRPHQRLFGLRARRLLRLACRIGELIDADKPAAVVVLLGANDRQQMQRRRAAARRCAPRTGSRPTPRGSRPWQRL